MPMNSNPPMSSVDRIRKISQKGYGLGGSILPPPAPAPAPAPSPYGQPSGPMHDSIQQDFQQFTAPQPQPMLPPDRDLNTPVAYNPITGAGYTAGPKRRM
jgi:hypothetical protein